jgi:hypothetical protein
MVNGLLEALLGVGALVAVLVTFWAFVRCLQRDGDDIPAGLKEKLITTTA